MSQHLQTLTMPLQSSHCEPFCALRGVFWIVFLKSKEFSVAEQNLWFQSVVMVMMTPGTGEAK